MYHYFDDVRNTHGEVLTGFFVRCVDVTSGAGATLYSDVNLTPIASVSGVADAAQVDADGNLDFYVGSGTYHVDYYAADGVSLVKRIQNVPMTQNILDTSGVFTVTTSGFGYSVGNGSAATQATSKSTAVTLNKPTGQVTMSNASIASNAVVTFQLNNSCIGLTDVLLVNQVATVTTSNYRVWPGIANGFAYINVQNISGGALAEAVVLNFAVIKGQSA